MLSKNKLIEFDEDIDINKTEDIDISKTLDIDICKTEDIDISKTEDIDVSKTEDIDISKTEDKDEDTDRDMPIRVFRYSKQWHGKRNGNWKRRQIVWIFWNNSHVSELCEKGYILMVNMHTQGLKSFVHIRGRCFLLENIRQLEKISQTHT